MRSDTALMRFQEHLMLQALALECVSDELRESVRMFLYDFAIPGYVLTLLKGDAAAGRTPKQFQKKELRKPEAKKEAPQAPSPEAGERARKAIGR